MSGAGWRRPGRLALPVLLLFCAVPLRNALLHGEVVFQRDVNMVWLPQVQGALRVLAAPAWPLWDPLPGFGRPLLADPRAELLYPFTWLHLLLDPGSYYTLFCLAHLFLAAAGMYALAREWGCTRPAALAGAGLLAGSGPLLSLAVMWHHLAGAAWLPWLFLALERALGRGRRSDMVLFALAFALHVLAGSPDVTALALPALALFALWPRPAPRAPLRARVAVLSAALGLGLLLSAAQWLPTLAWSFSSQRREAPRAARVAWSLPPVALADLLVPLPSERWPLAAPLRNELFEQREPWLRSLYLGLPGLVLAGLGLRARPHGPALGLVAVGAVGFALGRHGPFYDLLCVLAPPLAWLRFPVKGMILAAFALAALAALGLDAWTRAPRSRRLVQALAALAPAAGLQLALRWPEAWPAGILQQQGGVTPPDWLDPLAWAAWQTCALGAAATLLALAGREAAPAWARAALALLVAGAPLLAHHDLIATAPAEIYRERPGLLGLLRPPENVRLFVADYSVGTGLGSAAEAYQLDQVPVGWPPGAALARAAHQYLNPPTAARWGLRGSFDLDILGFEPRPLARLVERLREEPDGAAQLRLLRLGSVTHALALLPAPWWAHARLAAEQRGVFRRPIRVFEVPDPLPRAYAVTGARVLDEEAALQAVASPGFDPLGEAVLLEGQPRAARGPAGEVRLVESAPDRLRLQADLRLDGLVVVTEAWDAGWRARVDGRPAPVLRANLAFRAVPVPAGRHGVELAYRPAAVAWGLLLSLVAAAACAILAARTQAAR